MTQIENDQLKGISDKLFDLYLSGAVLDEHRKKETETLHALNTLPEFQRKNLIAEFDKVYGTHYMEVFITEKAESPDELNDQTLIPACDFPFDELPSQFADTANLISESLSVDSIITAIVMFVIVSGAVGNVVRVQLKGGYEVPLFLWLIMIAASGYGKSPLLHTLLKLLKKLQAKAFRDYQIELTAYENQLRIAKQKKDMPLPVKPKMRHYFLEDFTIEALASVYTDDPRGVVLWQDELAGLITGLNQYKKQGNDRQHLLELFNAEAMKVDRKSGVQYIRNSGASIIGGLQPSIMPQIFKEESFAEGLLPRFLMIVAGGKPVKFNRQSIPIQNIQYWESLLTWLYEIPLTFDDSGFVKPSILTFSESALNEYERFYNDIGAKIPFLQNQLEPFIMKQIAYYTPKFSGILHCIRTFPDIAELKKPIDVTTIKSAIRLTEFFMYQTTKALQLYKNSQVTLNPFQKHLIDVLFSLQDKVQSGQLPLSVIRESYNNGLPDGVQLSSEKIASLLKSKPLNLQTRKSTGNLSNLLWDTQRLREIFSQHTVTTVTNTRRKVTEVTVSSDDFEKGSF